MVDWPRERMVSLTQCECEFCPDCLAQYVSLEILAGSYNISCPDPACPREAQLSLAEVEHLVEPSLAERHRQARLDTEVRLDPGRAWCPGPDCQTVCHLCPGTSQHHPAVCPSCQLQFCSGCLQPWQPGHTCLPRSPGNQDPFSSEVIKWCPMCRVPIERDAGCAQMMCRRCRHVFCWYCMASLDVSTTDSPAFSTTLAKSELKSNCTTETGPGGPRTFFPLNYIDISFHMTRSGFCEILGRQTYVINVYRLI